MTTRQIFYRTFIPSRGVVHNDRGGARIKERENVKDCQGNKREVKGREMGLGNGQRAEEIGKRFK